MADWTTDNPHYKNAAPMLLYDTHRVEQAEQDPWFQRRKRGGKNSRRPIPAEDVNSMGAFRSIPPVPLNTQQTAFEQREAVAQVQDVLGVPRKQIAQELGVSEATVRRYFRTPEQRAESATRAQRQLHAAETARQAAAARLHELEREERAQRHQVRLSARALYDTGLTADEVGRHTENHTIPSRKIHNGIRRQTASRQMDEHSTRKRWSVDSEPPTTSTRENSGATIASRRPRTRTGSVYGSGVSHSDHFTHQRHCADLFQPQGRYSLTDSVNAPACPQRKDFGHLRRRALVERPSRKYTSDQHSQRTQKAHKRDADTFGNTPADGNVARVNSNPSSAESLPDGEVDRQPFGG